jgi:hypothetical protein
VRAGETKIGNPDDKVMAPCAGHITQCGIEDKAKIVYVPKTTITITNEIVTTSVVVGFSRKVPMLKTDMLRQQSGASAPN